MWSGRGRLRLAWVGKACQPSACSSGRSSDLLATREPTVTCPLAPAQPGRPSCPRHTRALNRISSCASSTKVQSSYTQLLTCSGSLLFPRHRRLIVFLELRPQKHVLVLGQEELVYPNFWRVHSLTSAHGEDGYFGSQCCVHENTKYS